MKNLILFFTICAFQFQFDLKAQETVTEKPKYKHSIGAAAGFTTGYGLSYRYIPTKFGVQLTFGPYTDERLTQLSSGLTFMYYIFQDQNVNFFLYQGNHYLYRHSLEYIYFEGPFVEPFPEPELKWITNNRMNNGIGFGFDFNIGSRISWNILAGYAAYNNFSRFTLTGETSLYFKL
ncbi:MAG: hypothetical protein H0V01_01065 [Bacteroidetes bacterium]|nr:hypothetical protein [Bacteroidota bacterium]HET6244759.1 hypothetical protein [Bacteroidia bacterium]